MSCLGVCLTWKAGGHKCAGQPGTSPCLSESCPPAGPAVLASGALVVLGFYYYYFLIPGLYSALASCQGGRMLCVSVERDSGERQDFSLNGRLQDGPSEGGQVSLSQMVLCGERVATPIRVPQVSSGPWAAPPPNPLLLSPSHTMG